MEEPVGRDRVVMLEDMFLELERITRLVDVSEG